MSDDLLFLHKEVVNLTERLTWARANIPTAITLMQTGVPQDAELAMKILQLTIELIEL